LTDKFKEDLLSDFVLESREHLEAVEPGLLQIEENLDSYSQETINEVFRAIHSLKGSAAFFGFNNIKSLAHVMENLLMKVRDKETSLDSAQIDVLIKGTDKLCIMIDDLHESENIDVSEIQSILQKYLEGNPQRGIETEKETEPSLPESLDAIASLDSETNPNMAEIDKLLLKGNKLYTVRFSLSRHIYQQGKKTDDIKELLASIGTVLNCDHDLDSLPPPGDPKAEEIVIGFTVATVLQKDYLVEGLEIEPNRIQQVEKEELTSILQKSEESEENDTGEKAFEVESTGKSEGRVSSAKSDVSNPDVVETLRVPVPILNKLMDLAGELVLNRNQLKQLTEFNSSEITGLGPIMQSIDIVTSELQATIMNARLQPVGVLFNKFPRVVRDLAHQLNKEIDLDIRGKDVDMDKSIIETLSDPLTHLVRNSVDHGVELPEERVKRGKPRKGVVTLNAYHKSGQVFIDISDDGGGIDPRVIKKKIIEKNLVSPDRLNGMNPDEILKLIFLPGFSTNEEVSEVSGRGVGMDVVKTNIEKLGGSLGIQSKAGEGTKITLKLPLTLAIIPSQIVDVAGERYALPQVNLEEMVQVGGHNSKYKIEKINGKEVLRLRGELLPLVDLHRLLKYNNSNPGEMPALSLSPSESDKSNSCGSGKQSILILTVGSNRFGLLVYSLLDSEEIVVKPLSPYVKTCKYYAGATILGDGRVAMILDVAGLSEAAQLDFKRIKEEDRKDSNRSDVKDDKTKAPFLVFTNSPGEYFALPLSFISRIDKITFDSLVTVEGKTFFKHQGSLIRLIWLNDFMNVTPPDDKDKTDYLYVLIPKIIPHTIGICATNVHDIMETNALPKSDDHSNKGIIGTAVIDEKPILFIDIYELFEMVAPDLFDYNRGGVSGLDFGPVLLAESNPVFMAMLKKYLNNININPVIVKNGIEAFREIQHNNFQIVLLSENLSILDASSLISQVKTLNNAENIRFIILTDIEPQYSRLNKEDKNSEKRILKFDKYALCDEVGKISSMMTVEAT